MSSDKEELQEFPIVGGKNFYFWPRWSAEAMKNIEWKDPAEPVIKKEPGKKSKKIVTPVVVNPFVDSEICILPEYYQKSVFTWKRPNEIFTTENISVFCICPFHIRENNLRLNESPYYIHLMDIYQALFDYDNWKKEDFQTFGFKSWLPTNHIYSGPKTNSTTANVVKINSYGKYAVRLYNYGAWRYVVVDDRIPVNEKNEVLMPYMKDTNNNIVDLWPILLTKAILKMNSYRQVDEGFYIDQRHAPKCRMYDGEFCKCIDLIKQNPKYLVEENQMNFTNALYFLTGSYIIEYYNFPTKNESTLWTGIKHFLEVFQFQSEADTVSNTSRKTRRKRKPEEEILSRIIVAFISISMNPPADCNVNNVPKNTRIEVLCTQCRDVPLKREFTPTVLEPWKKHRWIYWAQEKGIWYPDEHILYRSLCCNIPFYFQKEFECIYEKEWLKYITCIKSGLKVIQNKPKEDVNTRIKMNWIDYKSLVQNIKKMVFFNKESNFRYFYKITDDDDEMDSENALQNIDNISVSESEKKFKKSSRKFYSKKFDERVYKSKEIYLYSDDLETAEGIIDLNLIKTSPEDELKEQFIEIYCYKWYSIEQELLATLRTKSFISKYLQFSKGRKLYRINFSNVQNFSFRLATNSHFKFITNYEDILMELDSNSALFTRYVENVQNAFSLLIQSIGETCKFTENLQNFYTSLVWSLRGQYKCKEMRRFIYDIFFKRLFDFFEKSEDSERISTINRLFRFTPFEESLKKIKREQPPCYWKDEMKRYNAVKDFVCDSSCQTSPLYTEAELERIRNFAAILIQKTMKGFYVKQINKYHQKKTVRNAKFIEDIQDLFKLYFNKQKPEEELMFSLFRHFFFTKVCNKCPKDLRFKYEFFDPNLKLKDLFEFSRDFRKSVYLFRFQENTEINENWTPLKIAKLVTNNQKKPIDCLMRISSHNGNDHDSEIEFSLRIFDELTLNEIKPIVDKSNFSSTIHFHWIFPKSKMNCYTIYLFLYSPPKEFEKKSFQWSFEVCFMRHNTDWLHICDPERRQNISSRSEKIYYFHTLECSAPCDPPATPLNDWVIEKEKNHFSTLDSVCLTDDEKHDHLLCDLKFNVPEGKRLLLFGFFQFHANSDYLKILKLVLNEKRVVKPFLYMENLPDKKYFILKLDNGKYSLKLLHDDPDNNSVNKEDTEDCFFHEEDDTEAEKYWCLQIGYDASGPSLIFPQKCID